MIIWEQEIAINLLWNQRYEMLKCKNTKGPLGGNSVKNIISYHSFEFLEKETKMIQYYSIGAGMFEPYSENWLFESSVKVLKPFGNFKNI